MPLTGLTMARLKEHFRKFSAVYIAGIIICLLLSNIVYTSTRPQIPDEREVLVYLVDGYTDAAPLEELASQTLAALQPEDDTLESVQFSSLMFSDPETDYNGTMLMMTRMAVGDGDIYLAAEKSLDYIIRAGVALPLDEYLEAGWLADLDLEPISYTDPETDETYIAGLSLDNVPALAELGVMQNQGSGLVVAVNGTNVETSMNAIEYIIRTLVEGTYAPSATAEPAA